MDRSSAECVGEEEEAEQERDEDIRFGRNYSQSPIPPRDPAVVMTPRRAAAVARLKVLKDQEATAIRLHRQNAVTFEKEKVFEKELRGMRQARYNMADQRDEGRAETLDAIRQGPFQYTVKVNIKTILRRGHQRVI